MRANDDVSTFRSLPTMWTATLFNDSMGPHHGKMGRKYVADVINLA